MPIINAVITRCNSLFKSDEEFFFDKSLRGISFNGKKVVDLVFCSQEPMYVEMDLNKKEGYFKDFDLSKGLNHYDVSLCFTNLEETELASNAGYLFEVTKGVVLQFVAVDAEEDKEYRELKVIQK